MLVVADFSVAIVLLMIGLLCWGTWGMLLNRTGLGYEVSNVYFVCAQTFASTVLCISVFVQTTQLQDADTLGCIAAFCGGTLIAYANALLTKAINIGGVAVAVPAVIGSGLVGGTILNYLIDPQGNPVLLFTGLGCCVIALGLNTGAYVLKQGELADEKRLSMGGGDAEAPKAADEKPVDVPATSKGDIADPSRIVVVQDLPDKLGPRVVDLDAIEDPAAKKELQTANKKSVNCELNADKGKLNVNTSPNQNSKAQVRKMLMTCMAGGTLSALWAPVSVWASNHRGMGAYQVLFFFNLGQLLVIPLIVLPPVMRGVKLEWGVAWQKVVAFLAGLINVAGLMTMFVAGEAVSFAVAFGILQCSPLAAALWGVFFGELRGATPKRLVCFFSMMFTYVGAILCISFSQQ